MSEPTTEYALEREQHIQTAIRETQAVERAIAAEDQRDALVAQVEALREAAGALCREVYIPRESHLPEQPAEYDVQLAAPASSTVEAVLRALSVSPSEALEALKEQVRREERKRLRAEIGDIPVLRTETGEEMRTAYEHEVDVLALLSEEVTPRDAAIRELGRRGGHRADLDANPEGR